MAASFTTILPGLESLGAVEVLLPTVSLGVPPHDATTTFRLPDPFSQIQITVPVGSWVARRRSDGTALTATVFSLAAGATGLPGAACGPAVDLGPHDFALAAPLLLALPCASAPPDPAATPAIHSLSAGRWAALPPPPLGAAGPAYANGTARARLAALTAQAVFWVLPPPPPPPAAPAAGTVAAAVLGAVACCLAAAAAARWLLARTHAAPPKVAAEPLAVAPPDPSLPAAAAADSEALPAIAVPNSAPRSW
jgi:hypothetical protein